MTSNSSNHFQSLPFYLQARLPSTRSSTDALWLCRAADLENYEHAVITRNKAYFSISPQRHFKAWSLTTDGSADHVQPCRYNPQDLERMGEKAVPYFLRNNGQEVRFEQHHFGASRIGLVSDHGLTAFLEHLHATPEQKEKHGLSVFQLRIEAYLHFIDPVELNHFIRALSGDGPAYTGAGLPGSDAEIHVTHELIDLGGLRHQSPLSPVRLDKLRGLALSSPLPKSASSGARRAP